MIGLAILLAIPTQAKIWRVNNLPGTDPDFSDLQPAINAASAGDTIMVEASAIVYNNTYTVNKRLILIGAGYYLGNPKTQANPNSSQLTSIFFNPGSEGSVLEGFYVTTYIELNTGSITIQRNYSNWEVHIANLKDAVCNNDTIRQNILGYLSVYGNINLGNNSVGNLMVYNNIFTHNQLGQNIFFLQRINDVSGFFINNIFEGIVFNCSNFVFQNNIFIGGSFGNGTQPTNTYFNNLSSGTLVPTGNGNVQNLDMSTVFVGYPDATGFTPDGRFKLKAGSPAIGSGVLGATTVDCGVFGGVAPYVLSGMASLPSIYSLTVPASVPSGSSTMNVSISSTTVH